MTKARRRLAILIVTEDRARAHAAERQVGQRHDVRTSFSVLAAIMEIKRSAPDVVVCQHEMEPVPGEDLLEMVAKALPSVRRILCSDSPPATWRDLLEQGLVHAVVDSRGATDDLLSAIEGHAAMWPPAD